MDRKLDSPEIGAILAALRLYQKISKEEPDRIPDEIRMISTDDGYFKALTNEEIDELADSINDWRFTRTKK